MRLSEVIPSGQLMPGRVTSGQHGYCEAELHCMPPVLPSLALHTTKWFIGLPRWLMNAYYYQICFDASKRS